MRCLIPAVLFLAIAPVALPPLITPACAAEQRRTNSNLPYRLQQPDQYGNVWMLYSGGRLMQQGNMPFMNDSGMFSINGQQVVSNNQQISVESSGEAVMDSLRAGQFSVTRRMAAADEGGVRICDIIKNPQAQNVTVTVSMSFNVNFGIQSTRTLSDPRKTDKVLANIVIDSQNRSGIDVYAGRGAKVIPTINAQPNNQQVTITYELKIPANKEVAIVHFHNVYGTQDQAEKFFATVREAKALATLPPEVRKIVANYATTSNLLEDMELLRGGATDIVELTNGDQLRGTLARPSWELAASFAKLQIPADQLAGVIIPTGLQQRHLVITTDGEIIGGQLAFANIDLQLSSGQSVSLPISQISRVGRKSPANPEETDASPAVAMIYLRSGDRLAIKPPALPIKIATRFGTLAIKPETLATLDLQPDTVPAHTISLTDGSHFTGLLLADTIECQLNRGGNVSFPAATVRKLSFATEPADNDTSATVTLIGDDQLSVSLPGKLSLITSFGQVEVNGPEVKRIARVKNTVEDVQITLWDDSAVSGRFADPTIGFTIAGNTLAKVPVTLIDQYICPAPQPANAIVERITKLVADLNADDWKQREKAETDLLAIGQPAAGTLKQLRPAQPPEAQQRIDSLLKQLGKSSAAPARSPAPMNILIK